jgi:hypothetical protein
MQLRLLGAAGARAFPEHRLHERRDEGRPRSLLHVQMHYALVRVEPAPNRCFGAGLAHLSVRGCKRSCACMQIAGRRRALRSLGRYGRRNAPTSLLGHRSSSRARSFSADADRSEKVTRAKTDCAESASTDASALESTGEAAPSALVSTRLSRGPRAAVLSVRSRIGRAPPSFASRAYLMAPRRARDVGVTVERHGVRRCTQPRDVATCRATLAASGNHTIAHQPAGRCSVEAAVRSDSGADEI